MSFGDLEKDEEGRSLLYQDLEDVWCINKEFKPGEVKNKNKLPDALIEKMILYSSNKDDVVCDFFQGNFTTAMVAKSLGCQPCGFEINKESYDYHIKKLDGITYGSGLDSIRKPDGRKHVNQGKPITDEEKKNVFTLFTEMIKINNKKDSLEKLSEKFGRGKFAIINILKKFQEI